MTEGKDVYELSRRQVLGGLGTIGLASAGAGLGTSAYFSDEENFEANQLVAGSLDMKVDWEEHYSDWSVDEEEAAGDIVMTEGDPEAVPEGSVGLPDPTSPLIAVPSENLDAFMDATAVEAFPDPDDDGVQNEPEGYVVCDDGADTPEDLDPTLDTALRTLNQDTVFGEVEEPTDIKPLVYLDDVKPGDFGEVTFSFHLCENPGYVWMNGALDQELTGENGQPEPEAKDPDEGEGVELLDAIQTAWWYDTDGDNVIDGEVGEPPDVQIVLDASGSMTATDGDGVSRNQEAINGAQQLAEEIINAGGRVGVTFFSADGFDTGAQVIQSVGSGDATDVTATQNAIATLPADGGATAIGEGILTADEDLGTVANGRDVMVVVTDGGNNAGTNPSTAADDVTGGDADDFTDEIFAIGTGGSSEAALLSFARPQDDVHAEFTNDLTQVIANLAAVLLSEEVIFRGSLRESLDALSTDNGIPLDGNLATAYDEVGGIGNETGEELGERECFNASDTAYVGFAWWLPVDHANEIMTDSVGFDIGFYTEQCRHNTGDGMQSETATPTPTATSTSTPT